MSKNSDHLFCEKEDSAQLGWSWLRTKRREEVWWGFWVLDFRESRPQSKERNCWIFKKKIGILNWNSKELEAQVSWLCIRRWEWTLRNSEAGWCIWLYKVGLVWFPSSRLGLTERRLTLSDASVRSRSEEIHGMLVELPTTLLYWVLELHSRLQLNLAAGTSTDHRMRVEITNVFS